jgi:hypothetical protein
MPREPFANVSADTQDGSVPSSTDTVVLSVNWVLRMQSVVFAPAEVGLYDEKTDDASELSVAAGAGADTDVHNSQPLVATGDLNTSVLAYFTIG